MRFSNLTIYQKYNTQPIRTLKCSPLYSLEPKGIGTDSVESLTSYIQRLALAHCVYPGTLIIKMCNPIREKNGHKVSTALHASKDSRGINGTGSTASGTINAIQILTSRNDLVSLTLLPFTKVIPSKNLFRSVKAWCPICFLEWRELNQEIYEPLLWTLTDIKVCLRHSCLLCEACLHCGNSSTQLTWRSRPGYCSKCDQWLGQRNVTESQNSAFYSPIDQSFNLWKATHLGKLLADSQEIGSLLTQEKLSRSFSQCIDIFTDGNKEAFARLVNKNTMMLRSWYLGLTAPSIRSILQVCFCLNLPLVDFLMGKIDENLNQANREDSSKNSLSKESFLYKEKVVEDKVKPPILSNCSCYPQDRCSSEKSVLRVTIKEKPKIQMKLEAILSNGEFQSIEEIAIELGVRQATLYKHFPELNSQIVKRHAEKKAQKKVEEIRSNFEQLIYESGYPPGVREAAKILHTAPAKLRKIAPDLCALLNTRRAQYRELCTEQRALKAITLLESALNAQDIPPLSLAEVARLHGYHERELTRLAKELCKSISLRYRMYQKKSRQHKIDQACEEVQAAAIKLHEEGIYPSLPRIGKFLSLPGYFREPKVKNAWREILRQLGYTSAKNLVVSQGKNEGFLEET